MRRFLVVDDHAMLRAGLMALISKAFGDVQFGEGSNCSEARALLRRQRWDLILLDLGLPGQDGIELLEDVKHGQPPPPVIVLSMYPAAEYGVEAIRRGASAYLSKSAGGEDVIRAIREVLAGRRYIVPEVADRIAEALAAPSRNDLTSRELQVLRMISEGCTLVSIARSLSLSEKTIFTYKSRICRKLNVDSMAALVRYALEHGIGNCRFRNDASGPSPAPKGSALEVHGSEEVRQPTPPVQQPHQESVEFGGVTRVEPHRRQAANGR